MYVTRNSYVWIGKRSLSAIALLGICLAFVVELFLGHRLDSVPHDIASVYKQRMSWRHSAVVAVDDNIPLNVGRTQMLPLFALATERLVQAGATSVYLDARVPLTLDPRLSYAQCIGDAGEVSWSLPRCKPSNDASCGLRSSSVGRMGPLRMSPDAFEKFYFAPPHIDTQPAKYWALFGYGVGAGNAENHVVLDRLVYPQEQGSGDGVSRWFDIHPQHAIMVMANSVGKAQGTASEASGDIPPKAGQEICGVSGEDSTMCQRVRLGPFTSQFSVAEENNRSLIPLSAFSACSDELSPALVARVKGRAVILQTTAPLEPIDFHTTPMTVAWNGDAKLTAGPQYLADSVDTYLLNDGPRLAGKLGRALSYAFVIALTLLSVFWVPAALVFSIPFVLGLGIFSVSVLSFPVILLPVFGPMIISIALIVAVFVVQRSLSLQEAKIVSNYLPGKVRSLVLEEGVANTTFSQSTECAVLISDIAGYTGFTSLVDDAEIVFKTINQYLDKVTNRIQSECGGWLEGYTGDEVCFYWPIKYDSDAKRHALEASLLLNELQASFFTELLESKLVAQRPEVTEYIKLKMMSGIGLSFGKLVMGNIGPTQGVKKFGILGDPLNLSARLESLTRYFSSDMIVASAYKEEAQRLGYSLRYLASIRVKGRIEPEQIYGLERQFASDELQCWEGWIREIESSGICPEFDSDMYAKDVATIKEWFHQGLLDRESCSWHLDRK